MVMATIIVVEDSASTLRMIVDTLKTAGHIVMEAENGAEALEVLSGKRVDLIITDINMPHMDGVELTQKLRRLPNFKFTPILMLTIETAVHKRLKGKKAGATAWLVKPFDSQKLITIVAKLIRCA
jgi:two-component system chemotaxis response regulator CheY